MQMLAKVMDVIEISVHEKIPGPEGKEEPRIILHAIKDRGKWDFALGENGEQGFVANFFELDIDTVVHFEGLDIKSVTKIERSTWLEFYEPIDIAIVDTEELLPVPFRPEEPPFSNIVVSVLANFESTVLTGPPDNQALTS